MKPGKQIFVDYIVKALYKGTDTSKICADACKKFQFTERTFYNWLKIALQEYRIAQDKLKKELEDYRKQRAIEALEKQILSEEESKELLSQFARGKVEIPIVEVRWNPESKQFEKINLVEVASHTARISSITELNKMTGRHAPTKSKVFIDKLGLDELKDEYIDK